MATPQPERNPLQPIPALAPIHPIVARQRLSPRQSEAVLAEGGKVLVVAGAGTGKTKTLTARVLHILAQATADADTRSDTRSDTRGDTLGDTDADPGANDVPAANGVPDATPLRRIAAITFTRKAAREMRARLRNQISDYLQGEELDPAERKRWERLLIDLEAAPIGTIHGLCTNILRAHAAEAGLDPRFGVLEEGAAAGLVEDAIDAATAWAAIDPEGVQLMRALGVDALRKLCETLIKRRLDASPALTPEAEARLRDEARAFSRALRAFLQHGEVVADMEELAAANRHLATNARLQKDKLAPIIPLLVEAWEDARAAAAREDWDAAAAALERLQGKLQRGPGEGKLWLPLRPKEAIKNLHGLFERLLPDLGSCDPALDEQMLALLPALRALNAQTLAAYDAARRALRVLDFDDLEQRAVDLLRTNAEVRARWQAHFLALLVDEFQDTNERQRELIALLTRDPSVLTFVGDPKQSIYRFRGANVGIMQRERANGGAPAGAEGGNGAEAPLVVTLDASYRSHAALVDQLNGLLGPVLGYADNHHRPAFEPLRPAGNVQPRASGPHVELHLTPGTKGDGALECAAHRLAARLHELQAAGFGWGQMAILCRRTNAFEPYEDALEAAGIPYVTVAGRGFYDRPEVRDVLNALRAVEDPTDNLALLGLLRSPAVGMSDPFLFSLAVAQGQEREWRARGSEDGHMPRSLLWTRLRVSTDPQAQAAVALVTDLHQLAGRSTVATLIKTFYDRTGYVAAMELAGQSRSARNLAKLQEDALRSGETSIGAFLNAVEVQRKGAREGEAHADSDGEVQIMTVHAAKGLQWPVVVIGDVSGDTTNNRRDLLLLDGGLPYLNLRSDGPGNKARSGRLYTAAEQRSKEAEAAESDRLLYVAATRAEQLLLFSGTFTLGKSSVSLRGWLGRLTESLNLDAHLGPLMGETPTPGCGGAPLALRPARARPSPNAPRRDCPHPDA